MSKVFSTFPMRQPALEFDFGPVLSDQSVAFYAACAGSRAPARSVSEDGRTAPGEARQLPASGSDELPHLTYTFARGIGWDAKRALELAKYINLLFPSTESHFLDMSGSVVAPIGNHGDNQSERKSSLSTHLKGYK
jgi:hypothetical protein